MINMNDVSLNEEIVELEKKKKELIEEIKKYTKDRKLKSIEYEAVSKLAELDKGEEAKNILKEIRRIEYKISTRPLSPNLERKLVKKVASLEQKLSKLKPYLHAKKRKNVLEKELKKIEEQINRVEEELSSIRKRLKELYSKRKKKSPKVEFQKSKEETLFTLEDVVEIEGLEK